jgi:glc operon protein GlcG
MRMNRLTFLAAGGALWCVTGMALAQAPAPIPPPVPQYGASVNHEQARRTVAAAIANARKQNLPMAVAVVDTAGLLVAFERMDNTQTASTAVAQDKAVSAAMYRRPTKAFQDVLAGGGVGLRVITLRGAVAVEGGLPLIVDGKIIGAIGVSGGTSEQDGGVAKAGVDGLAAK